MRLIIMQIIAVIVGLVALAYSDTCNSRCTDYKTCSILANDSKNISSLVNNTLVCDNSTDATLGKIFKHISACEMKDASIGVTQFLGMSVEAIGAVEALVEDKQFFNKECQWDELAAALCLYGSLPADAKKCTNGTVNRSDMFCANECMLLMKRCFNFNRYTTFRPQAEAICKDLTNPDVNATNCYAAQVSQKGVLSQPSCSTPKTISTSLTGPYIVAGISLALAVVALVGLILMTCRGSGNNLQPNSF